MKKVSLIIIFIFVVVLTASVLWAAVRESDSIGTLTFNLRGAEFTSLGKKTVISLYIENSERVKRDISSHLTGFQSNQDGNIKFGFDISIPNNIIGDTIASNLDYVVFNITSEQNIEIYKQGFRYLNNKGEHYEYIVYDFSDILDFTNDLSFERISDRNILLKFDVKDIQFSRGDVVFLDPLIFNNTVTTTDSYIIGNLTYQSNFVHISSFNNSIVLYNPFDIVNTSTITTVFTSNDYSMNVMDLSLSNSSFENKSCFYGSCIKTSFSTDYLFRADAGSIDLLNMTIAIWINMSGNSTTADFGDGNATPIITKGREFSDNVANSDINYFLGVTKGDQINLYNTTSGIQSTAGKFLTFNHTAGNGDNKLLIVSVAIRNASNIVGNITYGGTGMIFIRADNQTADESSVRSEIFYLINPPATEKNISISLNGTANTKFIGCALSFNGVNQTDPIENDTGISGIQNAIPTNNITTLTDGSLLFDNIAYRASSFSSPTADSDISQEERCDLFITGLAFGTSVGLGVSTERVSPQGTKNMNWTLSAGVNWSQSIIAIKSNPTKKLVFTFENSSGFSFPTYSNSSIVSGRLYHVAGTHNGTDTCVYIDGVQDNCTVHSKIIIPANNNIRFGVGAAFNSTSTFIRTGFFNGTLDDLIIFNIGLKSNEIKSLYNNAYPKLNGTGIQRFLIQDILQDNTINRINISGIFKQFGGSFIRGRFITWNGLAYNDTVHGYSSKDNNVLYFHLDSNGDYGENESFIRDYSKMGNNGTNNLTNFDVGRFNLGAKFSESFIEVKNPNGLPSDTSTLSIAFWFKSLGNGTSMLSSSSNNFNDTNDPIISRGSNKGKNNIWFLGYNQSSGNIVYTTEGTNNASGLYDFINMKSSTVFKTNVWYHIAILSSSSIVYLYVNNVVDNNQGPPPNTEDVESSIFLGMGSLNESNANPEGYCNCIIDELLIFNSTLTLSELSDIYFSRNYLITGNNSPTILNNNTKGAITILNTNERYAGIEIEYNTNNRSYSPTSEGIINSTTWDLPDEGGGGACSGQIDSCTTLDSSCDNTIQYVSKPLLSNSSCLIVTGRNITIDGNGSTLGFGGTSTNSIGIDLSDTWNNTIRNFAWIWDRNTTGTRNSDAIKLARSKGTKIINNTIEINSTGSDAIDYRTTTVEGNNRSLILIANNTIRIRGSGATINGIAFVGFRGAISNVSIQDNNITKINTGATVRGIFLNVFRNVSDLTVENNTIRTDGSGSSIVISGLRGAKFINNNLFATSSGTAFDITNMNDSVFIANKIRNQGTLAAIHFRAGNNNNNTFIDNNITSQGNNAVQLVSGSNSLNLTFLNGTITSITGGSIFYLLSVTADGIKVIGINSTQGSASSTIPVIRLSSSVIAQTIGLEFINSSITTLVSGQNVTEYSSASTRNTKGYINFTNTTWSGRTRWLNNSNNLTINSFWYLDVYVNWSNGTATPNANVTGYDNRFGVIRFSLLTDSEGRIETRTLQQYRVNSTNSSALLSRLGTLEDFNNYTINVSVIGSSNGINQSQSWNMTKSRFLNFEFTPQTVGGQSFSTTVGEGFALNIPLRKAGEFFRRISQSLSLKAIAKKILEISRKISQSFDVNIIISKIVKFKISISQRFQTIIKISTSFISAAQSFKITISQSFDSNFISLRVDKFRKNIIQVFDLNAFINKQKETNKQVNQGLDANLITSKLTKFRKSISQFLEVNTFINKLKERIILVSQSINQNLNLNKKSLFLRIQSQSIKISDTIQFQAGIQIQSFIITIFQSFNPNIISQRIVEFSRNVEEGLTENIILSKIKGIDITIIQQESIEDLSLKNKGQVRTVQEGIEEVDTTSRKGIFARLVDEIIKIFNKLRFPSVEKEKLSGSKIISPNNLNTVPHIKLGERMVFPERVPHIVIGEKMQFS